MKKFALFLLLVIAIGLSSCWEEEADLRFSTLDIVNPDNIQLIYDSPDPHCLPKGYSLRVSYEANEITLKCKNEKDIYIDNHDTTSPSFYTSTEGQWSAEIVNSTTVKITFDPIDYEPEPDQHYNRTGLVIAANKKKEVIDIYRLYYFQKR